MLTLVEENPMITINGLTKRFGNVTALDDISVFLKKGEIIGLLGENGSGKTTLLKILAGLYMDYEGCVQIDGQVPSAVTKGKVSYLPDKVSFDKEKNTKEVLTFYRTYFDDFNEKKCRRLLQKMEIDMERPFKEMSKGMIEKVQLCVALSRDAMVYLLDEPIGGVDSNAREVVMDAILDSFDGNSSMIIVTHQIHQMQRLMDRAVVLKEGRIIGNGLCEELVMRYGKPLEEIVREMK